MFKEHSMSLYSFLLGFQQNPKILVGIHLPSISGIIFLLGHKVALILITQFLQMELIGHRCTLNCTSKAVDV